MRKTSYYGTKFGAIEIELRANRHGAPRHINKIVVGTVRRYEPEEHPDGATLTFSPSREITGKATILALQTGLSQARATYRATGPDAGMAAYDTVISALIA